MKALYCMVAVLLLALPAAAEEHTKAPALEISVSAQGQLPIGSSDDASDGSIGGGVGVLYRVPVSFVLPLGVSARIEAEHLFADYGDVNTWLGFTAYAGVWTDVPLIAALTLRPEIGYGAYIHYVDAAARGADGTYVDHLVRIAVAARYALPHSITAELAPAYTLIFEEGSILHYAALRAGITIAL